MINKGGNYLRDLRTDQEIMRKWKSDTSKPLVSIDCIAYNHEKYIEDALEGFLIQETDFPFEILVHDDASTDKTADIIKEYEARYPNLIKPIYQIENQFSKGNYPSSINRKRAKGKYIALCEGDDYWLDPKKLQKQADFLEENPDYSMCFHGAMIDAPLHFKYKLKLYNHLENKDYSGEEILKKWTIPTASVVHRAEGEYTDKLNNIYQHPDYIYGDIILFLNLAELGKIHCMNQKMSVYRIHEDSVLNRPGHDNQLKYIKHFKAIKEVFGGKYRHINDTIIAGTYVSISIRLFRQKKIFKAMLMYMQSLRYDPGALFKKIFKKLSV